MSEKLQGFVFLAILTQMGLSHSPLAQHKTSLTSSWVAKGDMLSACCVVFSV